MDQGTTTAVSRHRSRLRPVNSHIDAHAQERVPDPACAVSAESDGDAMSDSHPRQFA